MADGFVSMVERAQSFFTELRGNNSKDWFAPRKAHYEVEIKKPAEFLAEILTEDLGRLTGQALRPKVFRIYRDVRFSKDKTPLNAHLHLMWSDPSGDAMAPTWFWGLSPDYFLMGVGLMSLDASGLARFRAHVDAQGDALAGAIAVSGASISDWGPEPLKRVPKPYAPDHPHGDLLRRKAIAVSLPMPDNWRAIGVQKASVDTARTLLPVAQAMGPT